MEEKKAADDGITRYEYDASGRITGFTDGAGRVTYTYDANGNVLTSADKHGTVTRAYNELNRVTYYRDVYGNEIRYTYDDIGNVKSITYPSGKMVTCDYYKNGLTKSVTDWNGAVTSYEYDKADRLVKTTRADGSVEEREYDLNGNLTKIYDHTEDTVINLYTYEYDLSGNIRSMTGTKNKVTENNCMESDLHNATMEYDKANRLISYNGEEVTYDKRGNMTYGPLDGRMQHYTYDSRNRLIKAGDTFYSYDADNNRIASGNDSHVITYVNDTVADAVRVIEAEKKLNKDNGTDISTNTEIESGSSALISSEKTLYVYGNGLVSQEVINLNQADNRSQNQSVISYFHYNNIGNTTALTDSDGNITGTFTYGAYGELLSGDMALTVFRYNGRYGILTDANNLCYMRTRYYNTAIKRFINRDIVTGSITNSQSLNRYCYVQGNPVRYTDPFGMSPSDNRNDPLHDILDLLGLIPGAGIAPDLINSVIYFAEGDVAFALLSLASALPLAGEGVTGVKITVRSSKIGRKVSKGIDLLSNSAVGRAFKNSKSKVARKLDNIADTGKRASRELLEDNRGGIGVRKSVGKKVGERGSKTVKTCEFFIDDWNGYPDAPKPDGPFRILEGTEYTDARNLANKTNANIHRNRPDLKGTQIHEMHPVKFGGSPTDIDNKIALSPKEHAKYTAFWNKVLREQKGK